MSWGKFEWVKKLKNKPKYAEIRQYFHSETDFEERSARNKGFLITEVKTE